MNLEICKSGHLGLRKLEIWESGNRNFKFVLHVAVKVWMSRSPDFHIFKINFLDFQNESGNLTS